MFYPDLGPRCDVYFGEHVRAPALILRYIEVDGYRPPDRFMDAVLAAPDQASREFHDLMERLS